MIPEVSAMVSVMESGQAANSKHPERTPSTGRSLVMQSETFRRKIATPKPKILEEVRKPMAKQAEAR